MLHFSVGFLRLSLDCELLIVSSILSNVYLHLYTIFLLEFEAAPRVWDMFFFYFIFNTFTNTYGLTFQLAAGILTMSI